MSSIPTFYIPHGAGPCFFMDWNPPGMWDAMGDFLKGIAATLPEKPRAILLISAHWEGAQFTVSSGSAPELVYDYYGFPPHTYDLTYPAPGDPALAGRVADLLESAGLAATKDPARGFDHGMFIPLKLIYPDAYIPVVQLSLRSDYNAAAHVAAGRALASLRDEGVLIVGSGMSFHNMAGFRDPAFMARARDYADAFTDWLTASVEGDPAARDAALGAWVQAPHARLAHPEHAEEHLLPLMVAAGAAGDDRGACVFDTPAMGMVVTGYRFG